MRNPFFLLLLFTVTAVQAQFELRSRPKSFPLTKVVRSNNLILAANEDYVYHSKSLGLNWADFPYGSSYPSWIVSGTIY